MQKILAEESMVVRPTKNGKAENCNGTKTGVGNIDRWLEIEGGKWDVIHFNWGLHDMKREIDGKPSSRPADPPQSTVQAYEKQLRQIVEKLKATGARLIFSTTTPVPEGCTTPYREDGDVILYNAVALRVMTENHIAVNDLYAFVKPREAELQLPKNVHFKPEGYKAIGEQVAAAIKASLK
ncbi:MAG: SGNH/GDSL hydrolase family protein [Verrucomicrobiaceae bacterium]